MLELMHIQNNKSFNIPDKKELKKEVGGKKKKSEEIGRKLNKLRY